MPIGASGRYASGVPSLPTPPGVVGELVALPVDILGADESGGVAQLRLAASGPGTVRQVSRIFLRSYGSTSTPEAYILGGPSDEDEMDHVSDAHRTSLPTVAVAYQLSGHSELLINWVNLSPGSRVTARVQSAILTTGGA